jgi:hypothetical protein
MHEHSASDITGEDALYLKLDQTIPQDILGGLLLNGYRSYVSKDGTLQSSLLLRPDIDSTTADIKIFQAGLLDETNSKYPIDCYWDTSTNKLTIDNGGFSVGQSSGFNETRMFLDAAISALGLVLLLIKTGVL